MSIIDSNYLPISNNLHIELFLGHLFNLGEVVVEDEVVDTSDHQAEEEVGCHIREQISYNPDRKNKILQNEKRFSKNLSHVEEIVRNLDIVLIGSVKAKPLLVFWSG